MAGRNAVWKVVVAGTALATGVLARSALAAGWRRATHEEPPKNPAAPNVDWPKALAWSAAAGLVGGLSRLAARRGAAGAWTRALGTEPPV